MNVFKVKCIKSIVPEKNRIFEENKYYFCYSEETINAYWIFFNEYNPNLGYRFYKNKTKLKFNNPYKFEHFFIDIKKDRKLKLKKLLNGKCKL